MCGVCVGGLPLTFLWLTQPKTAGKNREAKVRPLHEKLELLMFAVKMLLPSYVSVCEGVCVPLCVCVCRDVCVGQFSFDSACRSMKLI